MKSIFSVPVAVLSLVEATDLVLPVRAGSFPDCIPRAGSFCDWVFVAPTPNLLVFEDLSQDIRWAGLGKVLLYALRLGLAQAAGSRVQC